MKRIIKSDPALFVCLFIISLISGTVQAETWSIHSGGVCAVADGTSSNSLNNSLSGAVSADNGGDLKIICPLVRKTQNTNGAVVKVQVRRAATAETPVKCTLASVNWNGVQIGPSVTNSFNGTGPGTIDLNLSGPNKSTAWSNYSVQCLLPRKFAGAITNLALGEN